MLDFIYDIVTNVVANVVFWFGLGSAVAMYGRATQRKFLKFFGLDRRRSLVVCLSNAWVKRDGSTNPTGYLIARHELLAGEATTRLFGSTSFRVPDLVRGLVDSLYSTRGRGYSYEVAVSPSPSDESIDSYPGHRTPLSESNLIVVGASSRNRIRQAHVETAHCRLRLSNEQGQSPHQLPYHDRYAERRMQAAEAEWERIEANSDRVAVVERWTHPDTAQVTFFCLGQRGDTTWLATEYLARNWRTLAKRFMGHDFSQCLLFDEADPDYETSYRAPRVIAEQG